MKIVKIVLALVALFFMGWALMEQTKTEPNIWVQVIGVALFFYVMMRLMAKTPSNFASKHQEEVESQKDNDVK
ncbi:MAG: hypothetical protein LBE34_08910 [Flavobacteriaceae bacterium]|jgi:protein-S-isoprenylcysteine O-methyltransferase Ste14|nr:hypothetical protein [Flavobacteriaceae bacterium]